MARIEPGLLAPEAWEVEGGPALPPDKFKTFKPYLKIIQILADNLG